MPFNRNVKISLLLLLALAFPVFGGALGEQHVLIFILAVCFVIILAGRLHLTYSMLIVLVFFIFLQCLLVFSWLMDYNNGNVSISDFFSVNRPFGLAVMFAAFCSLLSRKNSERSFDFFVLLAFLFLLVLFLSREFFHDFLSSVYFSAERFKDGAFISVFASTYFASYFYYIIFLFSLCRVFFFRVEFLWVMVLLVSLTFIFFSQGKNAYLAAVFSIFIVVFLRYSLIFKFFVLIIVSLAIVFFANNFLFIVELLSGSDYFSLRQASLYLQHGFDFSSVQHRLDQIDFSFQGSVDNNFLGVGLGRDILLESYVSSFIYRYGIFGFVLYFCFFLFLSVLSMFLYGKTRVFEYRYYYAFIGIFFMNVHVLMISSPMFEMGKNSIFSIFILAMLFSLRRRDVYNERISYL